MDLRLTDDDDKYPPNTQARHSLYAEFRSTENGIHATGDGGRGWLKLNAALRSDLCC
jgi:hypothetical protein